ncbi:outer membrane lipoprotein-sorting protein [Luteolibacter yonseiensis]|uniref:Outer membrane lipoprotein-sorting protein n=1 Tax=Luteolibacter yonseiensis TaxID=1144680 RepID=A0A934V8H9_9BACT|nr:outer membrane lipoprotein-sorting protein [Luteolibacter yonseiensis]MBK1814133.1 outer membrane lipoprotein-sorting protein [Luteolibacter yonseiensis]
MNFKSFFPAAALAISLVASASAQQPSAQQILEGARISATLTKLDEGLSGNLKKSGANVPITLFLKGKDIQFQFSENKGPWRIFHMRIGDENFNLFEIINGKTTEFPADKIVQPIAGTDLTYEDLALRFFYWPNPKLEGTEDVGGQPCYKLRVDKPKGASGRYEVVYVWVHTKFGAFMRIRGHDKNGGLVKEFQVEDVMKVADNVWTLRKMQVATCDPNNGGRRLSITDVAFDSPKKVAPRGVR